MILARCPHCETTFRATPEALKLRAGKVRCGKCQQVFNALDHLVSEPPKPAAPVQVAPPFPGGFALTPPPGTIAERHPDAAAANDVGLPASGNGQPAAASVLPAASPDLPAFAPELAPALGGLDESPDALPEPPAPSGRQDDAPEIVISAFNDLMPAVAGDVAPATPSDAPWFKPTPDEALAGETIETVAEPAIETVAEPANEAVAEPAYDAVDDQPADFRFQPEAEPDHTAGDESAPARADDQEVDYAPQTEHPSNSAFEAAAHDPLSEAQAAGLVAARDSREAPGYSKWSEGALSAPSSSFDEPHKTAWVTVVTAVILGLMLLVQSVHHWRMEIASHWPDARPWLEEACRSANCSVPYPRDIGQINLEASELQIDPARGGMLVLNMTIKNRAPFPQEFPAVELTLTDTRDNVVVRRILTPAEWLPALDANASVAGANPVSTPDAFPANKEIAARLWIDAKDTGAVGYRLFVFYP